MIKSTGRKKKWIITSITIIGVIIGCLGSGYLLLILLIHQAFSIPSDKQLTDESFTRSLRLPGYSKIEILSGEGKGRVDDPRIVTLQITLDSFPDPVICQGQIKAFVGDPGYRDFRWDSLYCTGQAWLIDSARSWLRPQEGPMRKQCQVERIALVLNSWVEKKQIKLNDIYSDEIRSLISNISGRESQFEDVSRMPIVRLSRVYDLAPDLPDEKKRLFICYIAMEM